MSERNLLTPSRHLSQGDPCDKHRMDINPVHQEAIELYKVGGINWRRIIAENASQQVSAARGLPRSEAYARRLSVDESPEKWLITSMRWSKQAVAAQAHNDTVSWTARCLLIDALGYKCGHRNVEWTPNDHRDWKSRQQRNGGTRNECISKNQDFKKQTSLGSSEIASLLNAPDRTKMSHDAHSMSIPGLALVLDSLVLKYPTGTTSVSKAFEYVVGCSMANAITDPEYANRLLTTKGIETAPDDPFKIDPVETEERGTW